MWISSGVRKIRLHIEETEPGNYYKVFVSGNVLGMRLLVSIERVRERGRACEKVADKRVGGQ